MSDMQIRVERLTEIKRLMCKSYPDEYVDDVLELVTDTLKSIKEQHERI